MIIIHSQWTINLFKNIALSEIQNVLAYHRSSLEAHGLPKITSLPVPTPNFPVSEACIAELTETLNTDQRVAANAILQSLNANVTNRNVNLNNRNEY